MRSVILAPPMQTAQAAAENRTGVWLVERNGSAESYSNGLRIDNSFAVSNTPRPSFRVLTLEAGTPERRESKPVGIVYHTTESKQAPFVADQNRNLQRISVEVLNLVRNQHSYHFFIDRFGRVFRVVQEDHVAFHAGHSVWAGPEGAYVNLNGSFLGIAFEMQTEPGRDQPSATQAQIGAGRMLTEMLRARYNLPAANCVTHAQVSVNPVNMRIGYHTDWAGNFPFTGLGLEDNYAAPPASLWLFGFDYDPVYIQSTGARLLPGLQLAETQLAAHAARLNLSVEQYKSALRKHYKEIAAAAHGGGTATETTHEN